MSDTYKTSLIGSGFAFLLATSCCWLPWVAIGVGGVGLAGFSAGLEKYSGLFMGAGFVFLALGWYQFKKKKSKMKEANIVLISEVTCPECKHKAVEEMPTNACQYFYECENCNVVLKPKEGDCCVFCSYGTVVCPPIQAGDNCCA